MKLILLGFLCFALTCFADGPKPPYTLDKHTYLYDGCLIDAVEISAAITADQRLKGQKIECDILIFTYTRKNKSYGAHAACVFTWKNRVWLYDIFEGPILVKSSDPFHNPFGVASELDSGIVRACYWADYPHSAKILSNKEINRRAKALNVNNNP